MSLLGTERIKLQTTRSPWWCAALILVLGVGYAALIAGFAVDEYTVSVATTQYGVTWGSYVLLVLGAITVTSEYRFGTIRATFAAAPDRATVLAAKAAVVTVLAGTIGLVTAFAAWSTAYLIHATDAIDTGPEWRAVAGQGAVYAGYAVIAVGVGLLVRATPAAISLLLVWALVGEIMVSIIDFELGTDVRWYLPFANARNFTDDGHPDARWDPEPFPFGGPWGSLAYFLAIGSVILVAGIVVAQRRDA